MTKEIPLPPTIFVSIKDFQGSSKTRSMAEGQEPIPCCLPTTGASISFKITNMDFKQSLGTSWSLSPALYKLPLLLTGVREKEGPWRRVPLCSRHDTWIDVHILVSGLYHREERTHPVSELTFCGSQSKTECSPARARKTAVSENAHSRVLDWIHKGLFYPISDLLNHGAVLDLLSTNINFFFKVLT